NTVEAVKPAVWTPGKGIRQFVRIRAAEAGDDDLGLTHPRLFPVFHGIEEEVRRIGDPHAAVTHRDAGGDVQAFDHGGDLVVAPIALSAFQHFDAILARSRGFLWILDALG